VGPGTGIPDTNYIDGIAMLNSYSNVQTFGYIYSGYGSRPVSSMKEDIDVYQLWNKYTASDIHIDGVYLDGAPSKTKYLADLEDVAKYAKSTLTGGQLLYMNPARPVEASFYSAADYINAFEDMAATVNGNGGIQTVPPSVVSKSSVIIHDYTSNDTQLKIDTCALVNSGFAGGLITNNNGDFNSFGSDWAAYVADVASCMAAGSSSGSTNGAVSPRFPAASSPACPTITNAPLAPGQVLLNPSFENVDAMCGHTFSPWQTDTGFLNSDLLSEDGRYYFTLYDTNTSLSQTLTNAPYGTYKLNLYYRITYWSDGDRSKDSCFLSVKLDSTTLYSITVKYGNPTGQSWSELAINTVNYGSGGAGVLTFGVACTNSAKTGPDFDHITLAKAVIMSASDMQ